MEDIKPLPNLKEFSTDSPKKPKLSLDGNTNLDSQQLALCPQCNLMNSNLEECERCGTQFTREVHLVPAAYLQEAFIPKLIKVEDKKPAESSCNSTATPPSSVSDATDLQELSEFPKPPKKHPKNRPGNLANPKIVSIEKRTRKFEYNPTPKSVEYLIDISSRLAKGKGGKLFLNCRMSPETTIVEETFINNDFKVLHLLQIQPDSLLNAPFNDPTYSEGVKKLIFDSNCPLKSLADFLDRFQDVHSIQIGSDFFFTSDQSLNNVDISPSSLHWTNIKSLVVNFDTRKFNHLQESRKSETTVRSLFILKLAITGLPSLSHCDISFPHTPEIAEAVNILMSTKFPSKGRKVIDFNINEISFSVGIKPKLGRPRYDKAIFFQNSIESQDSEEMWKMKPPTSAEFISSSSSEEEQFPLQNGSDLKWTSIHSTTPIRSLVPSESPPSSSHTSSLAIKTEPNTLIKQSHPAEEEPPVTSPEESMHPNEGFLIRV